MENAIKKSDQFFYDLYGYRKKTHDTPYGPINIRKTRVYMFENQMFTIAHKKAKHYYADIRQTPLGGDVPEEKRSYKLMIRRVVPDGIVFTKVYKNKDFAIKKAAFLLSNKFNSN